MLRQGKKKTA